MRENKEKTHRNQKHVLPSSDERTVFSFLIFSNWYRYLILISPRVLYYFTFLHFWLLSNYGFCVINKSSLHYSYACFYFGALFVFLYQNKIKKSIFRRHVMTGEGGEGRRLLRIPQCLYFLARSTVYESVFGLPSLEWTVCEAKSYFIFIVLALDGHFLLIVLYFPWADSPKAHLFDDICGSFDECISCTLD